MPINPWGGFQQGTNQLINVLARFKENERQKARDQLARQTYDLNLKQTQRKEAMEKLEIAGKLLRGVTDEESFQKARRIWVDTFGESKEIPANYDPAYVGRMTAMIQQAKEPTSIKTWMPAQGGGEPLNLPGGQMPPGGYVPYSKPEAARTPTAIGLVNEELTSELGRKPTAKETLDRINKRKEKPEPTLDFSKLFAQYNLARAKAPADPIRLQMIGAMKAMGVVVPVSLPAMNKDQFTTYITTGVMPGEVSETTKGTPGRTLEDYKANIREHFEMGADIPKILEKIRRNAPAELRKELEAYLLGLDIKRSVK